MKVGRQGWHEVSLGEICEFKYGKSLPEDRRDSGTHSVFGSNGSVGFHSKSITDGATIVIGRKGSFGEVHFSPSSCWPIDTTYFVDQTCTKQDLRWLMYCLSGLGLTKINRSKTIPGLNREDAYRLRLQLPPLAEQRRIVEILDRAEALRAKRRAALAQLDTLTQSIFLDLFGDPRRNRKHFPIVPLGELCRTVVDGVHKTPNYTATGVPFVTVTNIVTGNLDFANTKFISEEEHEILTKRVRPERGDILVTKDGTIGVACPVETEQAFSIFVSVALLKVKQDLIHQRFLTGQFRTEWVQSQVRAGTKGIAIRHLHLGDFKKLRILLPERDLQAEFVRRIDAISEFRAIHSAQLANMDSLFESLQYRAFRGEL